MNTVAIDFEQFVQINHSEPVTTSEFVAKAFGKKHCDVLRKIEDICAQVPDLFYKRNFALIEKIVKVGFGERSDKAYELTKNGFMLLVMGFTGKAAMAIKIGYINAFDAMANRLKRLQMDSIAINHFITQEQALQIQHSVEKRSQRTGESYQKIYVGLHAYLGIDSYKTMPVEHFTAAIKYLESMPDAPELFKVLDNDVTVSRVNLSALIHYMDWCYYWFQDIRKGLSHFNDNLVAPMIDKFSDGHLAAGLLAYPLGIEMLPIDEMRYFPWTKDGKIQDKYWEIHIQKNMIAKSYI